MQTMTKADFARHIGVSDVRVSQYVRDGIITADALYGEGRSARIIVDKALEQVSARRHVGQALSNGLTTKLSFDRPPVGDGPLSPRDPDTAELIQLERLTQERRKNRLAEIEEEERLGRLIPVADFNREIGKISQALVNTYNGMAPDIANAFAAKFGISQRDALHLVRQVMSEKRAVAAEQLRQAGSEMPETIEAVIS